MTATATKPPVERVGFFRATVSSLRSRNFRLFFFGQTISNTGTWLTTVGLTLLVLDRTGSGVSVGVLSACQFGPILLLTAWGGVIVDRTNKRNLLMFTQVMEMLQSFALGALAFTHNAPLPAFYAVAAFGGCMLAFDGPARRTMVNEMVPKEDVANAVTVFAAMVNIARIAGPAIAGVLVVTVGYAWCFTVDGISYIAVIVALGMMRTKELRVVPVTPRGRGQVRAGLKYITEVPDLWISYAMLVVLGTLSYNFSVVFPLFVDKGLHESKAHYTLVYSSFSVGALIGAVFVARRQNVTVRTVALSAVGLGVALLVLAGVPNIWFAFGVASFLGVANVSYFTATTAIAQLRTDPAMLGRVIAIQGLLVGGTTPLGGPLLGLVADRYGGRWPVVIGGVGALGGAAFGLLALRRVSRRHTVALATAED
jgi:MFS family permease